MSEQTLRRETFLKIAGGAGLALGFGIPRTADAAVPETSVPAAVNAYVKIAPDNTVTIVVSKSEMGQGVATGLPMIVAEELEYPYERVRIEFAPAAPEYIDPVMHQQATNGSTTTPHMFEPMRRMGATARTMLAAAAAQRWGVDPATLVTKDGYISDPATGRRASYGTFASAAAALPVPANVTLKSFDAFTQIGQRKARKDIPLKVDGRAKYGMDVKVPGMVYASVQKPPVFGGKVVSYDASKALRVKGVKRVVQIASGVAVIADNTWSAMQGRYALHVVYDDGPNAGLSTEKIYADAAALARKPGAVAVDKGNVATALPAGAKRLDALYRGPYLAHAAMEPLNATAYVHDGVCEVWAPTQAQTASQATAAKVAGLPVDRVHVTTTYLGGGFGRKGEVDAVADAVEASKLVGAPVKVVYTREDDMQHDFYRSTNTAALSAALDPSGKIVAWSHRVVNASIFRRVFPNAIQNGVDRISVAGAAKLLYDIPNMRVEYVEHDVGIPVGFWRAPGANWNAFAVESFVDELAHAAGQDPYAFRRANIKDPRGLAALDAVAEKAGWGKPLPRGVHRGIAIAQWDDAIAAEVVEASFAGGVPQVHRIVIAADCGLVINPDVVEAQLQSAAIYGLSAALTGKITIERGRVVQNNFYDYTVLRQPAAPRFEIELMPSKEKPLGVGELSTPAVGPAFANAYFAATGKRLRELPFTDGVKSA